MSTRRFLSAAPLAAALLLAAGCAKEIELKMAVEVVSEPERAAVRFRGKPVGETPKEVSVDSFKDLQSILAERPEGEAYEKRIRILAPDKAQVIFRFGKDKASAVAQALGIQKILIFDYSEKVSFDSARFDLKPDALPILNKQADILNTYFPNASVYVCGYTDATGGDDFNLKLSLQRAQAVADYLAARQVEKSRMKVRGFGKDYPVDTNATAPGRSLNRRTEVILPQ